MSLASRKKSQRKFTLAMIFTLTGVVGLFVGVISENGFITLAGIILSIYGASNIADYYVNKGPTQ